MSDMHFWGNVLHVHSRHVVVTCSSDLYRTTRCHTPEDHNINIHYYKKSRITCQHNLICVKSHFSTAWNQPPLSNTVRYYWNPKCVICILSKKNSHPQILHQFQCGRQPALLCDQSTIDTAMCSISHTTVNVSTELWQAETTLSLWLIKHHIMKIYREVEIQFHLLLT